VPDPSIFRAYDIRGVAGEDFDPAWVERLGRACAVALRERRLDSVVIGRDCRHSSPEYHDALARGLLASGISVISLGLAPTPLLYFAVRHLGRKAGIMITASHNPAEYNGFKIWMGASTIYGEELQALRLFMEQGAFVDGHGVFSEHDISPAYEEAVRARIRLERPITVVVDGGNGTGGPICCRVLQSLGAKVIPLFCEPDGDFPNHHPDPVVADNMRELIRRVRAENADCGIGLDGDADRIGVTDRNGRLLFGDELVGIYAGELLRRRPGSVVIGDVKCSQRLFDAVAAQGGKPIMSQTGHSLIKARMQETGAQLAGEMSGHMFFADGWFGFDDGIYSAARLLGLLSASQKPLEDEPGWPPAFATPEINLPCPDAISAAIVRRAQEHFAAGHEVNTLDGARVNFGDGWGLVRASNTQPVLVTRFEAATPERLQAIQNMMLGPLREWIAEATDSTRS
jgi:phosphomannomutase/phosphoglucomutase